MSLHRIPWRRPAARRPVEQQTKAQKRMEKRRLSKRVDRNTRRRRIWDLLRHIPAFLVRFLRLLAFVVFLLPAFVVFVWHYVTCDRIAAYYGSGNSQYADGDGTSAKGENARNGAGDAPENEDGVCNGSGIRKKHNKQSNDPFFSRHYLDIYGSRTPSPDERRGKKPVVIFLTGGAWIIGYRMWGCLLGRALAPFGILVIVPDYRNFPRVNIEGMVRDVDMSIQWAFDHVEEYGGDRERIVLVGQSAGAHIGGVVVAMKVLDWLRRERTSMQSDEERKLCVSMNELKEEPAPLDSTYSPQQLCGFISTSAPHNLVTMRPVFHHHGLSASVQKSIFGGLGDAESNSAGDSQEENVFEKWSPFHLVMKSQVELSRMGSVELELKDVFPRLCVIHGTADKTVPVNESIEFISLLTKLNVPTETKMYGGWTHTDPILEAPMRGNHTYHRDIYHLVSIWTDNEQSPCINGEKNNHTQSVKFDENHTILQPICPSMLVEAARFCNPF